LEEICGLGLGLSKPQREVGELPEDYNRFKARASSVMPVL
jgi:hypothetical protein